MNYYLTFPSGSATVYITTSKETSNEAKLHYSPKETTRYYQLAGSYRAYDWGKH